ncbi:MAG: hypothetical protein U0V56_12020 [Actinomycetota bacterium]
MGTPYEVARCRVLLSRACRAAGDDETADLEPRAGADAFVELGAGPDAAAADRSIREEQERRSGPVPARKTFLFTDIVGSTNLAEAMGDAVGAAPALARRNAPSAVRRERRGGRQPHGDGFFVAFDEAATRIGCAVASSAPWTITVAPPASPHRCGSACTRPWRTAGAGTTAGSACTSPRGCALAGGGEILASVDTLAEAGTEGNDVHQVELKGVSEPVAVATVPWA